MASVHSDSKQDDSLKIFVGHGSAADEGPELASQLRRRGYEVELFDASTDDAIARIEAWQAEESSEPRTYFLVVTEADGEAENSDWAEEGVVEQAAQLAASNAPTEVVLVVEESLDPVERPNNIETISFPPNELEVASDEIIERLPGVETKALAVARARYAEDMSTEVLEQPVVPESEDNATKSPILLWLGSAAAALLFLVFGGWLILQLLSSGDDVAGGENSGSQTAESLDTNDDDADGGAGSEEPGSGSNDETEESAGSSESTTTTPTPVEPADLCEITTAGNEVVPETVPCRDGGRMIVTGHRGPWHNNVESVELEGRLAGALAYEQTGLTVGLGPGVNTLEESSARFGVIGFSFDVFETGTVATFTEFSDSGGRQMTMTYEPAGNTSPT